MTFRDSCTLLSCRLFCSFSRKKLSCITVGRFHMDAGDAGKSTMELVNVPPIVSIYRHALDTFSDKSKKDLTTNLKKLKSMMDKLNAADLGFDKTMNDIAKWKKPNKAPCTYIEVFQNNKVNMSIFVLKPGFKMPLHDHPQMHGLLKIISGTAKIRSFTEFPVKEAKTLEFAIRAKLEAARLAQGIHKRRRLFAEITSNRMCTDSSETCLLTPTTSNYHEIEAMETPAAFFDILSPPYDTLIEGVGPRRCHYYHIVNEISTNLVELQETDVPDCFYCDQAPYLGPILG